LPADTAARAYARESPAHDVVTRCGRCSKPAWSPGNRDQGIRPSC